MSLRTRAMLSLCLIVPLGFASRFLGDTWINNWLGSIFYEMFFVVGLFAMMPRPSSALPIAIGVCLVTCGLEFAQLWKPPALETIRGTFPGRALLGTTFSGWDLPIYPVGCAFGWLWLRWITPANETETGP